MPIFLLLDTVNMVIFVPAPQLPIDKIIRYPFTFTVFLSRANTTSVSVVTSTDIIMIILNIVAMMIAVDVTTDTLVVLTRDRNAVDVE